LRYWDASALVPLIVAESDSELVRGWLSEDDHIVTWVWTRTEITSAIERRTRDGLLSRPQRRDVLDRLGVLADGWDEVTEVLAVRSRANALLARHALRAADAGQLGAALLVQEQLAGPLSFACREVRNHALVVVKCALASARFPGRAGIVSDDRCP
jgi:predicted nucleic acid-binding protein